MKIGIIREGKVPSDSRVALTPEQCKQLIASNPDLHIYIQPSAHRCYSDEEYIACGIPIEENLEDCEVLFGVKEVPIPQLISNKTYFFFSHTIKEQPYNRDLLRAVLNKNIRLIDYETLTDENGQRVIAFGRWAGVVGAHNGIRTWGKRQGSFDLKSMHVCKDFAAAKSLYPSLQMDRFKAVITGDGRVARGAKETLDAMGIEQVSPDAFLSGNFEKPVYTMLGVEHMYKNNDGSDFNEGHYFRNPEQYHTIFKPYTQAADIMINAIYWDNRIPAFFTKEEMKADDFRIRVIADITCDIAPEASIPSTLRASKISDPVYGYDPVGETECAPYQAHGIDVMAVDNLPNELPRDASNDFGQQLIDKVWNELKDENSRMIYDATIAQHGKLNQPYEYLKDFVSQAV